MLRLQCRQHQSSIIDCTYLQWPGCSDKIARANLQEPKPGPVSQRAGALCMSTFCMLPASCNAAERGRGGSKGLTKALLLKRKVLASALSPTIVLSLVLLAVGIGWGSPASNPLQHT